MTETPRISVVTACLNAAASIDRTLDSIAEQNYPNLEYIVYDGASTDGTVERIRARGNLVDIFVTERDESPGEAINKGFRRATGEILCYMNADDAFAPAALSKVAEFFTANPSVDVYTGSCKRMFADGSEMITQVPDDYVTMLPYKNHFEQPSTFWRADLHRRCGELDESYKLAFDWEWWNRMNAAGANFARTSDVLSVYYFTEDNLTSRAGRRAIDEMYRVTKSYGSRAVADAYRLLFRVFDMNGFYDRPFTQLSTQRKLAFGATLSAMYAVFGRDAINAYNWNWASKQIRGIPWYK